MIAFVDDDDDILEGLKAWATFLGLEATYHDSAESLLAWLTHQGAGDSAATPILGKAVIDFNLPGIDGLELINHLRQQQPDLPVVMISARSVDDLGFQALPEQVVFLKKPFQLSALKAALI